MNCCNYAAINYFYSGENNNYTKFDFGINQKVDLAFI